MATTKEHALYTVIGGRENDVIWAGRKTDKRPFGSYPVSDCDQEELAYLYDEVGQRESIVKVEMTKSQIDAYNKAKDKRENSGEEKKGSKSKK